MDLSVDEAKIYRRNEERQSLPFFSPAGNGDDPGLKL
jgi:hypothetical protein